MKVFKNKPASPLVKNPNNCYRNLEREADSSEWNE